MSAGPDTHLPAPPLPLGLIAWGAIGIALNVGLARFTYGVMLPAIRRDLGLGYLGSGSLNAVHLAGYLAGTLAAPWLLHRAGPPGVSRGSHLLVATGALLCALSPSTASGAILMGLGRLATGLGAGAGIVAILVVVFNAVATRQRPLVSALVWAGMGAAIIASGCAIGFLLESPYGWRSAFAASSVIAGAVAFGFRPAPMTATASASAAAVPSAAAFNSRGILSARWRYLVASYLLFGVAYVAYATFTGAQLAAMQASAFVVGATWVALGVMSILGAALSVPVVGSTRLKGYALIGAAACGSMGAAVASLNTGPSAFMGALLVGLGLAATPSIVSAVVRDRCEGNEYAKAFSLATAALGIGQLIGPLAGGALADHLGAGAIPAFAACAYGMAGLLALADALQARRGPGPT